MQYGISDENISGSLKKIISGCVSWTRFLRLFRFLLNPSIFQDSRVRLSEDEDEVREGPVGAEVGGNDEEESWETIVASTEIVELSENTSFLDPLLMLEFHQRPLHLDLPRPQLYLTQDLFYINIGIDRRRKTNKYMFT